MSTTVRQAVQQAVREQPIPVAEVAQVRHLDHLNLTVKNLQASLDFYRALFGFEVVERDVRPDGVPWAIVRTEAAMLCLYEFPDLDVGPSYPAPPDRLTMAHFALRITNGPAFYELLKRREIPLLFDGPVEWPHSTSYYIADPSGHQIEVVQWNQDTIAFDELSR